MKIKWIVLPVLAAGAVAGGVMYFRAEPAQASAELITADVSRGDVVETVQATGSLEAVTTVQVGSQVSGAIKALHADFNSEVRQGQVVAELDPSLFQTQVEQARATVVRLQADLDRAKVQVEDAQLKLKRARELSARQLIPASELETAESTMRQTQSAVKSAEAQIVQARASLNQNQVNLDHTIIKAPIDGIVVSRNVDVGQTVAASMQAPTLFIIAKDLTQMQVSASIDESDIGRIRPGLPVTFRVDAYPEDRFTGTVRQVRLQPVVSQNVVSYTTIIAVPNPDLKLRPGMTANVTVEIARADGVLRVPSGALRFRPTADLFTQLGQQPPAGFGAGRGGAGAPGGMAATGPGRPPGGSAPPSAPRQAAPSTATTAPAPPGDGAGGGFASMTPEARAQMRERMQQMTPEERQAMRERFQGGFPPGGAGGGGFANLTPEERQARREQMQQMSPEERQAMRQRFRPEGDGTAAPTAPKAAGRTAAKGKATAPVPEAPRVTVRPIWVLNGGKLERMLVSTSISDGAMTAVVGGALQPGAKVVTGVAQPKTAAGQATSNPFMPRFPGGPGGQRQGGAGAGGPGGPGARPGGAAR